MMESISTEILRKAAQGDINAFEQIYKDFAPFVYNVAYRMVEAKEDAEEVTQEVFLIVHKKLNSFMFRSSLKTWVYRITANCAINLLNKRTRDQKGRVDMDNVFHTLTSQDNPREGMESQDTERRVRALLNILNPQERSCIVLRNIEGLSYQQIASSLNENINTIRTRLKRAREKMLARKEVVADEL